MKQISVRPRDQREVRLVVRMGLWSVALMSPFLLAALFFTRDILLVLHQEPKLAADAGIYTSALAFGLPCSLAFQVLRNFSTSLSRAGAANGGDGAGHPVQRAGRLQPDLRPFRLAAAGTGGRGARQRLLQPLHLGGDDGDCAAAAQAQALPVPAPLRPAALAFLGRAVPSGPADRHHHAVRGGAVQRRHPGDGHIRHRGRWRRIRSPSPFPRSPSWCRWASGWRQPCGWALRRAPAMPMARGAPASPPWGWAWLSCLRGAAAAAVSPQYRHAVAARQRRQSGRAGAGRHLPACRRRVSADGRPAGDRLHEPARIEGRPRTDVGGGRFLLAGGRADVRVSGFRPGDEGLGIWLGLAFGLLVAAVLLTTRFALLSKKAVPAP